VCKSFAPRSRQITTPVPHHSVCTGWMLFLPPNQQHQNTEGKFAKTVVNTNYGHPHSRWRHYILQLWLLSSSLWPPCVADADIIFFSCIIFLLPIFMAGRPSCWAPTHILVVGLIANLKVPYFQPSLSVCVCSSDRHFYPSTLTNFDETWSQEPYCDLLWPRP